MFADIWGRMCSPAQTARVVHHRFSKRWRNDRRGPLSHTQKQLRAGLKSTKCIFLLACLLCFGGLPEGVASLDACADCLRLAPVISASKALPFWAGFIVRVQNPTRDVLTFRAMYTLGYRVSCCYCCLDLEEGTRATSHVICKACIMCAYVIKYVEHGRL